MALEDTVRAVLHQMSQGEASDLLEGVPNSRTFFDAQKDLRWCRLQLAKALREHDGVAENIGMCGNCGEEVDFDAHDRDLCRSGD